MPRLAFSGLCCAAFAGLALAAAPPAWLAVDHVPFGLPARVVPKDNPLTRQRVELGRRLFFDPVLSGDRTVSCASCHRPEHGFASPEAPPLGVRKEKLSRRAPSLWNRAYGTAFFWDGRASSLEEQALQPIENPAEMGSGLPAVVARLKADNGYRSAFEAAFPDGVTAANLARALASFQRVLLRGDSRVDRFRKKGDHAALSPAERHGLWLYESKAGCWQCHAGANFTDEGFHNTGVGWGKSPPDPGRFAVTRKDSDKGKFKTPSLRGVAKTAPYMHDGSQKTLEDVVEFYNKGGAANPRLDPAMRPLGLTKDEVHALVAFLEAL
ncbi:MAG: cytochrome c peroxidase [Gemmataceae bacterium]